MFCWAFPASVKTCTAVPTWREGRNGSCCLEGQLTTTTDQELNFSLLFLSCFPPAVDAASQQVFFAMVLLLLVFSIPWLTGWWDLYGAALYVLPYTWVRTYVLQSVCVCLWCFLFFFVCTCVWVCERECLSSIRSWIFFPRFRDDETAFLWSCKQLRCIDVPSMHLPLWMWWLLKQSSALSIQEPVTNKCELCQLKQKQEKRWSQCKQTIFFNVYCSWAPGRGECTY